MALAKATIREKLNLLLLVPLLATILLAVPFVASRVDDARTASLAARVATNASQISNLLYSLQRERLASVDHLVGVSGHAHGQMLRQQAVVDDAIAELRAVLREEPAPRIEAAVDRIAKLRGLRRKVVAGKVEPEQVYHAYARGIDGLLGSLGLDARSGGGTANRHLETLDSLLRANEASSQIGAALLVAAADAEVGRNLLVDATALRRLYVDRFVRVAGKSRAKMMRTVDAGESTKVTAELAEQVRSPEQLDREYVILARDTTESQAVLRQLMLARTVHAIETSATGNATRARAAAWAVGLGTLLLFVLVVALGVAVSRSIAGPVRHLTRAATAVAQLARTELARVSDSEKADDRPPRLAAIAVRSGDEVGDLGNAFNQVQATAARLLERQVQTRRNVGLMFASVARRTQNLVGGQLSLIDQLERNEQDPKLLAELYRLDHLSMRLRRSAESLLVVSGVRDESRIAVPAQLGTVLRSALAEIEDFRRVRLVSVCEVTAIPELVADLSLLLAELLENATSYSPPTAMVDVTAERTAAGCRIMIVDHGIGMPAEQLKEENRRFIERERLDIAPTTVLGLFVVGRLARRHQLTVELRPTHGGGITAVIDVPARLLTTDLPYPSQPSGPTEVRGRVAAVPPALVAASDSTAAQSGSGGGFGWFAGPGSSGEPEQSEAPEPVAAPAPDAAANASSLGTERADLTTAAPQQADLTTAAPQPAPPAGAPPAGAPPVAGDRAFDAAPPRRSPRPSPRPTPRPSPPNAAQQQPPSRGGLTRRVPGASLASTAQPKPRGERPAQPSPAPAMSRDPEQERAALDAFASAVARAAANEFGQESPPGRLADEGSTK